MSEKENIDEKITEEGIQFLMLIVEFITWTPGVQVIWLLFIVIRYMLFYQLYLYDQVHGEDGHLQAYKRSVTICLYRSWVSKTNSLSRKEFVKKIYSSLSECMAAFYNILVSNAPRGSSNFFNL